MKLIALIVGVVGAGLVFGVPGDAQPLRYWGKQAEAPTGWIELGPQQYHEIGVGTEIPGWGRVTEVRDDRLVVEQPRAEDEKQRLEDQGALAYDVLEFHILREDLRNPHSASPRAPHP